MILWRLAADVLSSLPDLPVYGFLADRLPFCRVEVDVVDDIDGQGIAEGAASSPSCLSIGFLNK